MSSANRTVLSLPFQFGCLFFFFLPKNLPRTSDTTVNESDENVHPYFIPSLRRKAFRFSPLSISVAVAHHIWPS